MNKLIFLDVDGVLNTHEELHPHVLCGQIHDDKVQLLNMILQYTDAKIVLSSAWRYIVHRGEMNLVGLRWLFRSHGVYDRLIGITAEDTMVRPANWDGSSPWIPCNNERGKQIRAYLEEMESPCEKYVVLDDMDLGIRLEQHPFVHINGTVGLTLSDCFQAIRILNATE